LVVKVESTCTSTTYVYKWCGTVPEVLVMCMPLFCQVAVDTCKLVEFGVRSTLKSTCTKYSRNRNHCSTRSTDTITHVPASYVNGLERIPFLLSSVFEYLYKY
jgi:hypothetical protein